MAEVLVAVGAAASISQIVGYIAKTVVNIQKFSEIVANVPHELDQISRSLDLIKAVLDDFQSIVPSQVDDDILPLGLRRQLSSTIDNVHRQMEVMQSTYSKIGSEASFGTRKKILYVIKDRKSVQEVLRRLEHSENTFLRLLQYLTIRILMVRNSKARVEGVRPVVLNDLTLHHASWDIAQWPLLKLLGFYGYSSTRLKANGEINGQYRLGFKFPPYLWAVVCELELGYTKSSPGQISFTYLPGIIRYQNQVSLDSPLMVACQLGTLDHVSRILRGRQGSVHDRTTCCGKTPLLLAVERGSIPLIQLLLREGADPNIGDDNNILPVFTALGMRSASPNHITRKRIMSLPPRGDSWIDIFDLLVKHNASTHEIVHGKSLTMLNTVLEKQTPQTLKMFRILKAECYTDFSLVDPQGWSALLTAIRSQDDAIKSIQFLEQAGVDLTQIQQDGRTVLHLAAEMAKDDRVLEYLCTTGAVQSINSQDLTGWTPLHYALISEWLGTVITPMAKIVCLLSHGANPDFEATSENVFLRGRSTKKELSAYDLCKELSSTLYAQFVTTLTLAGLSCPDDYEADMFYDAKEA